MDEDNSPLPETSKLGIPVSGYVPSPVPHVEPSIFSGRSDTGSLSAVNGFSESELWNVGNTRPPQHLRPFAGDEAEKTYLTYFVTGDMHTYWHGTKVRAEGGTTHLAQLELMRDLFGRYAKPIIRPTLAPTGRYGLRATFDLHKSFGFLIEKAQGLGPHILQDDTLFYSALSGFADAEGHVGLTNSHGKAHAIFTLSNRNLLIMNGFLRGLRPRNHKAALYPLGRVTIQWQLEVHGSYALNLLPNIAFRHREKIVAKEIATVHNARPWSIAGQIYRAHRERIRTERDELEAVAEQRYSLREERKRQKIEIWRSKVEAAFPLIEQGLSVREVAEKLHFSIRTAYRRMETYRGSREFKNLAKSNKA